MKRLLLVLGLAFGITAASLSTADAAGATTWLCRPGLASDPCTPGLSTSVFSPSDKLTQVLHPTPVKNPPIDCFYVYPTVSDQPTGNATLQVDPEERSIALFQAARYSQYCRVYAPMYRQLTVHSLLGASTTPTNLTLALDDLRSALHDYLQHFNHGRGFVLIGHSQGSMLLRTVIKTDIDPYPAVRKRLVSAIIPGGNVLVRAGSDVGGDFQHIPGCRSARQLGCVIGYSTFGRPIPPDPAYGTPNGILGPAARPGDAVLCRNPSSLGGGTGSAQLIVPSQPFAPRTLIGAAIGIMGLVVPHAHTVWVSLPGRYRAQCVTSNGANVLEVTAINGAKVLTPSPSPTWGLHLLDQNMFLGNLVAIVKEQASEWARAHLAVSRPKTHHPAPPRGGRG